VTRLNQDIARADLISGVLLRGWGLVGTGGVAALPDEPGAETSAPHPLLEPKLIGSPWLLAFERVCCDTPTVLDVARCDCANHFAIDQLEIARHERFSAHVSFLVKDLRHRIIFKSVVPTSPIRVVGIGCLVGCSTIARTGLREGAGHGVRSLCSQFPLSERACDRGFQIATFVVKFLHGNDFHRERS
jgi:hypothetical protein